MTPRPTSRRPLLNLFIKQMDRQQVQPRSHRHWSMPVSRRK